jgi:hypothetical protein
VSHADLNRSIHDDALVATGVVGADYARSQILPDGRVLWTFQDAFVGGDGTHLGHASFAHNIGVVQNGSCFTVLGGSGGSWIGSEQEWPLHRWLWPLDSTVTADGYLAVFLVEMHNPNGTGAAEGAEPIGVWLATIELPGLSIVSLTPAADSGDRPLYGFSISSDERYDYLYGQCYRQFADRGYVGYHDIECGPDVYLARVPLGHPEAFPEYWNGRGWSPTRSDAAPIESRGEFASAMQVRNLGGTYVSVDKIDDWWGTTIDIAVADRPEGPFRTVATVPVQPACEDCNTYFAQALPWTSPDGELLVSISNNAWNMARDAFPHPELYRPSVLQIRIDATAGPLESR